MNKKSDKRLCWNCEGDVSLHLTQCPFCGMDVTKPILEEMQNKPLSRLASPFQTSGTEVPKPPYANIFSKEGSVSEEEWNQAIEEEHREKIKGDEEEVPRVAKKEIIALLLLLPGIVFCLFGLALLLFSQDGVLTLQWNQSLAYFYFLGALPLIILGWRVFK